MKLKKFTYEIQGRKDVSFSARLKCTNTWGHQVEWAQSTAIILDRDGHYFTSCDSTSDETVDDGAPATLDFYGFADNVAQAFRAAGPMRATVSTKFFRRESTRVGDLEVPDELGRYELAGRLDVGTLELVGLVLTRYTSEGKTNLALSGGIRNKANETVERMELRVSLVGQDGREVEQTSVDEPVFANSTRAVSIELYDVKKARLKGARLQAWLDVYTAIANATVEGDITQSTNDDDDDDDDVDA
jgi:hypothetical protein